MHTQVEPCVITVLNSFIIAVKIIHQPFYEERSTK